MTREVCSTTPPAEDEQVWYREDLILSALQQALDAAVRAGGQPAKAIAWDINYNFKRTLKTGEPLASEAAA
ncbi:MAG TPA: hypothetical protein VE053_06620 [Allosphingosinicella sp.]|nr:hypothetical protein [Allosphingosinicella sp.]